MPGRIHAAQVAIGSFAAFVQGWALPFLLVLFGEAINELAKPDPMPASKELGIAVHPEPASRTPSW